MKLGFGVVAAVASTVSAFVVQADYTWNNVRIGGGGGFIPGIRAGRPTENYLRYVLTRITLPGALYLGVLSMIPLIALVLFDANQNFPFGGPSLLIVVGVGLDTVKQIDAQLQQRHYEGLLRT